MLPKNFYDEVEKPNYLKNILYSDTDSLFLTIPIKDADQLSTEQKLEIANKVSDDINEAIVKYLNQHLLQKSNVSLEQNTTFFKSEMLMDAIMFLDVKKNYSYKILAKKGKIFKSPKISYTGIQVVKSDAAKLTQDLLKEIIENVILNTDIDNKDKISRISEIVNNFYNYFLEKCSILEINEISFPGKWQKKDMFINGMKLYNHIMKQEIFSMGSAGNFIYCIFRKPKIFSIDISKTNGICIPYSYDKELLKNKFDEFGIEIDKETQWNKLFTTTCQRVVDLVKSLK